jgi:hypothetical protein
MRWVALCLLLGNLALGAWLWQSGRYAALFETPEPRAPGPTPREWVRADALLLVDEAPGAVTERSAEAASPADPLAGAGRCVRIGPFAAPESARVLGERLASLAVRVRPGRGARSAAAGLLVRLGDVPTVEAAERLVRELSGLGLEAYVIAEGRHAPGVSLGLFPDEGAAEERVAAAEELDLAPEIVPVADEQVLWWLVAAADDLAAVAPEALEPADRDLVATGSEGDCERIAQGLIMQ